MKIRSLVEAHQLIGHRVRYMRRGGSRFGWEGVIDYANTQKVRVVWDRPDGDYLTQEYQMTALYFENGEWDDGSTYIMVLGEVSPGITTAEENEEFERIVERSVSIPNHPLIEMGKKLERISRNLERLGKLMQDSSTTVGNLAAAAEDAGFNVQMTLQPKGEVTTNGDTETP